MKKLVLCCWSVVILSWPVITQADMSSVAVWLYPFAIWLLLILSIKLTSTSKQSELDQGNH